MENTDIFLNSIQNINTSKYYNSQNIEQLINMKQTNTDFSENLINNNMKQPKNIDIFKHKPSKYKYS